MPGPLAAPRGIGRAVNLTCESGCVEYCYVRLRALGNAQVCVPRNDLGLDTSAV